MPKQSNIFFVFVLLVSLTISIVAYGEQNYTFISPGDTIENIVKKAAEVTPLKRQYEWQRLEFTAFIHFTVNTFTDKEWGDGTESPAQFNPTDLDARQWVKVCKEAGIKQIILTCKHHDGFCLWPSAYTEHSVKNSPWKNGNGDVVKDISTACKDAGLRFGVYLSPWDRHEQCYGDSPRYNEHFRNQLTELLTKYGDIAEVWFDGACGEGPNGKRQVYDWDSYYAVIHKLQPNAVIAIMGPDVRWVGTESGYGRLTEWSVLPVEMNDKEKTAAQSQMQESFEGFIPRDLMNEDLGSREKIKDASVLVWYPSEVDVSIRPGWFYHKNQDDKVKTPEKLFDIYFSSVGRNSLLLLNIPPDTRGLFHENDVASLHGLREALDMTFKENFVKNAGITATSSASGSKAASVLDDNPETYWMPDDKTDETLLELKLDGSKTFDVVKLQENILIGQRIEQFAVDAFIGNAWKTITEGTTVGYMRLLRFPEVTTDRVRLRILTSRSAPALGTFGLYDSPYPPELKEEKE